MYNRGSTSLKYYKRLKVYKNSTGTVEFNPLTKKGRSYDWCFTNNYKGMQLFNSYSWSLTTSRHQTAVNSLLMGTAVHIDMGSVDLSFIDDDKINYIAKNLYKVMVECENLIEMSRKKDSYVNNIRQWEINNSLKFFKTFNVKLSKSVKKEIEDEVMDELLQKEIDRACEREYKKMMINKLKTDLQPIEIF